MYHAACKVEFQPFNRSYSQLTFFNFITKILSINRGFIHRTKMWLSYMRPSRDSIRRADCLVEHNSRDRHSNVPAYTNARLQVQFAKLSVSQLVRTHSRVTYFCVCFVLKENTPPPPPRIKITSFLPAGVSDILKPGVFRLFPTSCMSYMIPGVPVARRKKMSRRRTASVSSRRQLLCCTYKYNIGVI